GARAGASATQAGSSRKASARTRATASRRAGSSSTTSIRSGTGGENRADQGRRERTVLGTSATEDAELRWFAAASGYVAELLGLGEGLELLQRLVLDLPDALARDVEVSPDLVQPAGALSAQPVAELQPRPLAV